MLLSCFVKAQNTDTLKTHSPKLASTMSAILPGSGQIYNKKYWKPPIIYIAGGVTIYLAIDYRKNYIRFKNAYNAITDDDPNTVDEFNGQLSLDDIKYWRNKYRKYMEMNIIATAGIYILNIVDAAVDANFYDYDISDDLSLKIMPDIRYNNELQSSFNSYGLRLKIKF
ncbi:MAG: hypothetical protein DRI94_10595 [Bacteroidetes bacterium]|nr:MAG: hypothetical protein DRI94_10595 [Bacteroidota bacterium]